MIRVPVAPRRIRPVFINGNAYKGAYVRRHSSDQLCTKEEVDRMTRESSSQTVDAIILPGFGWKDLDRDSFARYRQRFQTAKPNDYRNGLTDQEFLEAMHGYRTDRLSGVEGLTVAGLLMFGKEKAIREWRSRHMFDYRFLASNLADASNWIDRIAHEGNLLTAFEEIFPRLTHGLPVPFRLEGAIRVDQTPVHVALREALINLLVHADYEETASSLIFRSSGGMFFQNPGNSRTPDIEIALGRVADPRNPDLVYMFRQINLAEEAGSGIQRIIRTWREMGYRAPRINVGTEQYRFTIDLNFLHLISEDDRLWLQSLNQSLNESEQMALLIARHEGFVDNNSLRSVTGEHAADTTKILGSLRNRDLLEMIGGGRGASYQLGIVCREESGIDPDAFSSDCEGDTRSVKPHPISSEHQASMMDERASGIDPEASRIKVSNELNRLADPAKANRSLLPQQIKNIIVALCAISPLTVKEIAILTNRSPMHVGTVLVKQLVTEGRLLRQFPNQARHPRQRYRSSTSPSETELERPA